MARHVNVDLHCHSTHSDGTWSVRQILREAEMKGIDVLAITDHDNISGSLEAYAKKTDVFSGVLVPGIEISTRLEERKIHLLAYFPTFELDLSHELFRSLEKIQNSRVWRMEQMIERAVALGFDVTFDEVVEEAGTGIYGGSQPTDVLSRPHLARVLIKKRYVEDFDEAFDKYLADGKPLHVERFTLQFTEWINLVHDLGGLVVWAHPLNGHDEDKASLLEIAERLESTAIDGVERIYNYKGKYRVSKQFEDWGNQMLDVLIRENNWLITAGGDFHGNVGRLGELSLNEEDWFAFESALFSG